MTAMVSSMCRLLRAAVSGRLAPALPTGVPGSVTSNGCASGWRAVFAIVVVTFAFASGRASAQEPPADPAHPSAQPHGTYDGFGQFLGGAAVGLGTHEAGHVFFDVLFDAQPGLGKVNFHGLPFFAITHRS